MHIPVHQQLWIYHKITVDHLHKTEASETDQESNEERACRFFDIHGIVHREFISEGQTVNADFYV